MEKSDTRTGSRSALHLVVAVTELVGPNGDAHGVVGRVGSQVEDVSVVSRLRNPGATNSGTSVDERGQAERNFLRLTSGRSPWACRRYGRGVP